MEKFHRIVLFMLWVSLAVSCNVRSGIVDNAPVTLTAPDKVVSLSADTTFRNTFPEVLDCYAMQIVRVLIFVLYVTATEDDPYHFKAYSTNTFDYLGEFIRTGRGPGEMIAPHIAKSNVSAGYLGVNDNQTGTAYLVDVMKSIQDNNTVAADTSALPSDVLDWLPLPDSGQFFLQQDADEMIYRIVAADNGQKTLHPYRNIDGKGNVTWFSSFFTANDAGKLAEIMIFFPQINFCDIESGSMYSVAVNREYRRWKSFLGRLPDMDTVQYYDGITSTSDYIFAIYKGYSLSDIRTGSCHGSSIHMFDWDGKFMYDIKVAEDISDMAYDSSAELMYCMDAESRIIRYDLSGIL